jgi:type I restriction enzyme R subunit
MFEARLDLVRELNERERQKRLVELTDDGEAFLSEDSDTIGPPNETELRDHIVATLRGYVGAMNLDNFVIRPHRRTVERFQRDDSWTEIGDDARHELLDEVAPLPSEQQLGTEPAKRFDLLMLNLQLALLKQGKSFDRFRKQLLLIAAALEEQFSIPLVAQQQELILDIQTDPWWEGVTAPLLELVRLRLRNLVQHVDRTKQRLLYTDFEDELGAGASIDLPQIGAVDFNRFKRKTRHWLLEHEDNLTLQKLRRAKPLTKVDLDQLARLLVQDGIGDQSQIETATELSHGLGRFIRSLVGLERDSVAEAFSTFVSEASANARQIEFIDLIIEHLTAKGTMDPWLLYESPFTDIAASGPEQVFELPGTRRLIALVEEFNESAVAR